MTDPTQYIASVDAEFEDEAGAMTSLLDVVALHEDLALVLERSSHAVITGPEALINKLADHFAGRIKLEVDQDMALPVPGPFQSQDTVINAPADDDDKDETEVHFF